MMTYVWHDTCVTWPGHRASSQLARFNHLVLSSAEGVVLSMDERFIFFSFCFLSFSFFLSWEFWCQAFLCILNHRDCRISNSVWITVCGVLLDISSSSWWNSKKYVINEYYLQSCPDCECTCNRDTKMQRGRETERNRDTGTQRHRETVTQNTQIPNHKETETPRHRDIAIQRHWEKENKRERKGEREKEKEKEREQERERERKRMWEKDTHAHTHIQTRTQASVRTIACTHRTRSVLWSSVRSRGMYSSSLGPDVLKS